MLRDPDLLQPEPLPCSRPLLTCAVVATCSRKQTVMPDVRIPEREERKLPRQCNTQKKGSFLLNRVRAPAATNAVVQGQRVLSPSCYPIYKVCISVAGLSRLATCLQSDLIGPNLHGLFSDLGVRGLFSFPLIGSLFLARRMLIGWLQVA